MGKHMIVVHPGEFLAEALDELGLSQAAFARAIGVSPMRISPEQRKAGREVLKAELKSRKSP